MQNMRRSSKASPNSQPTFEKSKYLSVNRIADGQAWNQYNIQRQYSQSDEKTASANEVAALPKARWTESWLE
jgi:hypothetical protein